MERRWGASIVLFVSGLAAASLALLDEGCRGATGAGAPRPKVREQALPRAASLPVAPSEVGWAEGVLAAAEMYIPRELEVLEVVHSTPTKQQAIDLATRLGYPPPRSF